MLMSHVVCLLCSFHANGMKVAKIEIIFWTPSSHFLPLKFQVWMPLIPLLYKSTRLLRHHFLILSPYNQIQVFLYSMAKQPPIILQSWLCYSILWPSILCSCGIPLEQSFTTASILLSHPQGVVRPLLQNGSINSQQYLVNLCKPPSLFTIFLPFFL